MGVKTILFSIILLHAFTATFNESFVCSFEQTHEPTGDESSTQMSDELGSGSPDKESFVCSFEQTHEPTGDESSTQMSDELGSGSPDKESFVCSFEQTHEPTGDESSTQMSDELGSGSPESSVSSFEQTDEPTGDESSTQMSDELGSGSPDKESFVCSFEQTHEPTGDESSTQMSDELGSGSPESSVSSFEQTDEPTDVKKYLPVNPVFLPSAGFSVKEYAEPYQVYGIFSIPLQNAEIHNETTNVLKTFVISDESVAFLKGLLVTRVMPSFYIIIILISLPLNALALVTFTCRIREKKPAVVYMSHLACVDLLFTLLLPLKIHYQLNASDWVFGEAACRVHSAAYYCYMYCSILLMMCMSVDRLLAVVFPVASLTWRSVRKATCICTLVWLLALAGTVPILLVRQTLNINDVGVTCHDVPYRTQLYAYLFSILSCLYFFLPLVITLVSYSTIIYVLSVKSDQFATSSSSSNSRRRAVIMTIAVVTEFLTCFAPTNGILLYHCVHLATESYSGEENSSYIAYLLAVCVGSASVFLDPLLYYYGSSHYRKKFWSVIRYRKTKTAVRK